MNLLSAIPCRCLFCDHRYQRLTFGPSGGVVILLPLYHHFHPCFKLSQSPLLLRISTHKFWLAETRHTVSLELPCDISDNMLPAGTSGYLHDCERRVQLEQAGFSPGHRVFFLLWPAISRGAGTTLHQAHQSFKGQILPTILAGLVRAFVPATLHRYRQLSTILSNIVCRLDGRRRGQRERKLLEGVR